MPRIRSVHPAICDDDVLAEITPYAERTFVRLWTEMDDEGRAVDNPKLLKAKLYPLHDSMTADRVEKDLAELEARGLLQRYEVDGRRYLAAKEEAWRRYQKPRHPTPSKLPPPPGDGGVTANGRSPTANGRNAPAGVGVGVGVGVEIPPSSSSDLRAPPEGLWKKIAEKKATQTQGIGNRRSWIETTAGNARTELGDRAAWLWQTYDITESQLVDVLCAGGSSALLNSLRKRDVA